MTDYPIQASGQFKYLSIGGESDKPPLLLLHGLFGTASNFDYLIQHFESKYKIYLPILPIFEMPMLKVSLLGLQEYIEDFMDFVGHEQFHMIGNSLGGHVALLLVLAHQERFKSLTLTASSGLYESAFGSAYPRKGDKEFIRNKIKLTFNKEFEVPEEMVEEVYGIVNNRLKVIRIIKAAKSAIRHNLEDRLHQIKIPTLLVWGDEDTITPPFVGLKFHELIKSSIHHEVKKCGHAPMLERPTIFNKHLEEFLNSLDIPAMNA